MLTEVKSQLRIFGLSFKYALMREILNKGAFLMNIIMMCLNNASFIVLWLVIYSIKDGVGGYSFKDVLYIWGLAAGTYGISHIFFYGAYKLPDTIINGGLDAYLVQPKNVLLQAINGVSPSAFGDLLYAYIMLFIAGCNFKQFIWYTIFNITGGILMTAVAIIYGSLSFWIGRTQAQDQLISMTNSFSTYPDSIFNKFIQVLFYTIIPVGFMVFLPIKVLKVWNISYVGLILFMTILTVWLSFTIFNKGLKRYSSTNLMNTRT